MYNFNHFNPFFRLFIKNSFKQRLGHKFLEIYRCWQRVARLIIKGKFKRQTTVTLSLNTVTFSPKIARNQLARNLSHRGKFFYRDKQTGTNRFAQSLLKFGVGNLNGNFTFTENNANY